MMRRTWNKARFRNRPRPLGIESLERRDLLSVDVVIGTDVAPGYVLLHITGSDRADQVMVTDNPGGPGYLVYENRAVHVVKEPFEIIFFEGFAGNDTFVNDTSQASIVVGGDGDDALSGGRFVDILVGGDGSDFLDGGKGTAVIYGDVPDEDTMSLASFPDDYAWGRASGNDEIVCAEKFSYVYGGPGADRITGHDGDSFVFGGAGDDWIDGGRGVDVIFGGPGNDMLRGGADRDILIGGDGNDILVGGDGDDELYGDDGRDLLIGGLGADTLHGSAGSTLPRLPGAPDADAGDILIGGTTAYDDNDRALMALLDSWTTSLSRDKRINLLRVGTGSALGYALNGLTVHDDHTADLFLDTTKFDWIWD